MAPRRLPFKITHRSRTKLQNLRQGVIGHNDCLVGVATLPPNVEIWTDHQNLCYFRKAQKLNRRQAQWVTELGEYNFTMHHKAGKTNIKADILSRRADHNSGEDDNKDVTVLKDEGLEG